MITAIIYLQPVLSALLPTPVLFDSNIEHTPARRLYKVSLGAKFSVNQSLHLG